MHLKLKALRNTGTAITLLCITFLTFPACNPSNGVQENAVASEAKTDPTGQVGIDIFSMQEAEEAARDPFAPDSTRMMLVTRRVYQDSKMNHWLGGDGLFCKTKDSLVDCTAFPPFVKADVRGIGEDSKGNMWFGTSDGLVRHTPAPNSFPTPDDFEVYKIGESYDENDIWGFLVDSKDLVWVGTMAGVYSFDGSKFTKIDIPKAEVDNNRGVSSPYVIHGIAEDSQGRHWFGSNGGAYRWDGEMLFNLNKEDGLCGNNVNDVLEDSQGNMWFATHHAGVCRWDGENFESISELAGSKGEEAWDVNEDNEGNVWFPMEGEGLYRYNLASGEIQNFGTAYGLGTHAPHCMYQDREGMYWSNGFNALYRFDGIRFEKVGKNGPW